MLYDERYSPLERATIRGVVPAVPISTSNDGYGLVGSKFNSNDDLISSTIQSDVATDGLKIGFDINKKNGSQPLDSSGKCMKTMENISFDDRASFIWGLWQCADETTFLLDENDIDKFPEGSLIVSPQRWKLIKLSGRPIDFDETGIVSAMSKIDVGVPSLNISTAKTNCTLVPEELLDQTLRCLSDTLKCPVREYS